MLFPSYPDYMSFELKVDGEITEIKGSEFSLDDGGYKGQHAIGTFTVSSSSQYSFSATYSCRGVQALFNCVGSGDVLSSSSFEYSKD